MEEVAEGGLLEAATASPPSLPVGEVSLEQSEALAGAVGLEALAARASVLPALPAHRLAASSVLFMLLLLLAVAVLVLAVRRPVLRRQALSNVSDEWAPINVDHRDTPDLHPSSRTSAPPELQLPVARDLPGPSSYNTFDADGDEAWQAAKRDWHAAIAAARRLPNPTGPTGEASCSSSGALPLPGQRDGLHAPDPAPRPG